MPVLEQANFAATLRQLAGEEVEKSLHCQWRRARTASLMSRWIASATSVSLPSHRRYTVALPTPARRYAKALAARKAGGLPSSRQDHVSGGSTPMQACCSAESRRVDLTRFGRQLDYAACLSRAALSYSS